MIFNLASHFDIQNVSFDSFLGIIDGSQDVLAGFCLHLNLHRGVSVGLLRYMAIC